MVAFKFQFLALIPAVMACTVPVVDIASAAAAIVIFGKLFYLPTYPLQAGVAAVPGLCERMLGLD